MTVRKLWTVFCSAAVVSAGIFASAGTASAQFGGFAGGALSGGDSWVGHPDRWGKGPMVPHQQNTPARFTDPVIPRKNSFMCQIQNSTNVPISYSINGMQNLPLQPGETRKITFDDLSKIGGRVTISFANGKSWTQLVLNNGSFHRLAWQNGVVTASNMGFN